MSLEAFAYSSKGIAHELGMAHAAVLEALEGVEPLLKSMSADEPPMPVSSRLLLDLREKASGEDQYLLEKASGVSPLVRRGVLATYASGLTKRDAEQAALSMECMRGPPRSPRVTETPEWTAYDSPDLRPRHIARRLVWQQ